MPCGRVLGHGEACVDGHECDQCIKIKKQNNLINRFANLFSDDITDMDQLDASDFKDKSGYIWDLVVEARRLRE